MTRAFIAMGTNVPFGGVSGPALLARAVAALEAAGMSPRVLSGIWETAAWPDPSQPAFCNAAAELDCAGLAPQPLYQTLGAIEAAFGRVRRERNGPRTLDLDILAIEGYVGTFGEVTLPHARLHDRPFVLAPLAEIAPGWRHPTLGTRADELLAAAPKSGILRRIGPFPRG